MRFAERGEFEEREKPENLSLFSFDTLLPTCLPRAEGIFNFS
jgi:hypothetical protein